MLPEQNKQNKITEWGYLLRDHHKFGCCWYSVHLNTFLLEQADWRGVLQAAARKKWMSSADPQRVRERVSTWRIIFIHHWALREVEQGESFAEERHSSLFITVQRRGESKLGKYVCRTIFHHPSKTQEDETQRMVWVFAAFNFTCPA